MSGIKYYQLAKGEEMPDEFCAVRDVGGEPSEYVFYVPEAENAKLRELLDYMTPIAWYAASECEREHMRELGVEADA